MISVELLTSKKYFNISRAVEYIESYVLAREFTLLVKIALVNCVWFCNFKINSSFNVLGNLERIKGSGEKSKL